MKNFIVVTSLLVFMQCLSSSKIGYFETSKRVSIDYIGYIFNDSTLLPDCIKALLKPASQGRRSSLGSMKFLKMHVLKNGKMLYVFNAKPSIGCYINEPESTKYYDESCNMVARFPINFSIKQGFKPFVAVAYAAWDFAESSTGDYPEYFRKLEKLSENKKTEEDKKIPTNPFRAEQSYKILTIKMQLLDFKMGDDFKISAKNGLKHFRKNKQLNTYKIIPQLILNENKLVHFLGETKRYIDIQNNTLFISESVFQDANVPTTAIKILWIPAFLLTPQNNF